MAWYIDTSNKQPLTRKLSSSGCKATSASMGGHVPLSLGAFGSVGGRLPHQDYAKIATGHNRCEFSPIVSRRTAATVLADYTSVMRYYGKYFWSEGYEESFRPSPLMPARGYEHLLLAYSRQRKTLFKCIRQFSGLNPLCFRARLRGYGFMLWYYF